MLGRLQVRDKVNLLVVIPLVLSAMLLVPLLSNRVSEARLSARTAAVAGEARQLSELVQELQQARLLAVAHLRSAKVDPNALVLQLQLVQEQRAGVQQTAQANGDKAVLEALGPVQQLVRLTEPNLVDRTASAQATITAYSAVVDQVITAANLTQQETAQPTDAWALSSLDSLLRSNESVSRAGALLLAATSTSAADRPNLLSEAAQYFARGDASGQAFQRQGSTQAVSAFAKAAESVSATRIADAQAEIGRSKTLSEDLPVAMFAAVQSATGLRQLVQSDITQGVATEASDAARQAQLFVVLISVLSTLLMALIITLSVIVGRSVSRPLRRLTAAAAKVADLAQDELLRVADEDATVDATPQLAEIDIRSADEIGELAQAFNRVQSTAAQLLERQVVSRRNVASMFASVGRRTTNLVGRQLSLIDTLERTENDPDVLSTLYRLDHLSTRLRRNANSLVVLSGGSEASGDGRPVSLTDAVRASLGSVEDYKRVVVDRLPNVYLSPGVVSDLLLLLAELLENAVLFSPPRTTVEVHARAGENGSCLLAVIDHGMGMPADRLAEENARLQRRERLDLAPTNVLGLFVVGRIARRHGLDVFLEPTPDHGITVTVSLPAGVLVDVAPHTLPSRPLGAVLTRPERGTATATVGAPTMAPTRASATGSSSSGSSSSGSSSSGTAVAQPVQPTAPLPQTPAVPTVAAAATTAAAPSTEATERPITRRVPGSHWTAPVEQPAPPPPPPAPAGAAGVRRRVPGSNLSPETDRPTAPVASTGEVDPDEARRQVAELEQALSHAADVGVDPPPPPPTAIDLARRAGVRRRVPGVALDEIGGLPAPAADLASTTIDPEAVRAALDDVGTAVDRAELVHHRTSLSAERFADEAARTAAEAQAAAREAALQEAAGRREEQRRTITDLAGELRVAPLEPVTAEPPAAPVEPPVVPTAARPARRVPGAALAALGQDGPDQNVAAGELPTGPIALGRPRVTERPERPDDVLSWVENLEFAMAAAEPAAEPAPEPAAEPPDGGEPVSPVPPSSPHDTQDGEAP